MEVKANRAQPVHPQVRGCLEKSKMKLKHHVVRRHAAKLLASGALLGFTALTCAQSYSIDWHVIAGGGGPSTGGVFAVSGTSGQPEAGRMSDSRFVIEGGFWSLPATDPSTVEPITIFDNTHGTFNGASFVTTTTWLASKFCLGPQPYQLDSVASPLSVAGFDVRMSSVRLQVYSNDPVSGKPSSSTGVIMNLSGMTNPISLRPDETMVTWTPAAPFTLVANRCYWAVLSIESGASVWLAGSATMPTGDAGAFGRVGSTDAGVTWGVPDTFHNGKMLIRGTASAPSPALVVNAVSITGNELRFSFPASSGQSYVIESRVVLDAGAWAEVAGTRQTSAGAAFEVSLPIRQSQPQQFYRVKQIP